MNRLKVGDRVVLTKNDGGIDMPIESIGTVRGRLGVSGFFEVIFERDEDGSSWFCRPDQLRLVDSPVPKCLYKFGDKVLALGRLGIVVKYDPGETNLGYKVALEDSFNDEEFDWYSETDLIPVTLPLKIEFKVGDQVKFDGWTSEIVDDQAGNWLPMKTSTSLWLPRVLEIIRRVK